MNMKIPFKQISMLALAVAVSAFAQARPAEQVFDSLGVTKTMENYNEFQIEKWGPVTYKGEGKCDILDLYQKSVSQGMGYSTVVDYYSKETKTNGVYSCESWGLGLSFKVLPDQNPESENYGLTNEGRRSAFAARTKSAVKKFFEGDSAYLEVESVTPVSFQTEGKCHVVDFLYNRINEESGFHGLIDVKANDVRIDDKDICTFWGLAVKYKRRAVVEKVTVKRRVVDVVRVPLPKPDTVYIPKPTNKPASPKGCCFVCNCEN